ncbi:MAG: ATP-binding protein [Candidatus Limnocylindrales bacterium]
MTEERRLVTVLFADVTGSTALGESLDPEALRGLLGRYFTIARAVVESYGGTVEKFIGDAVMAVFGLPMAHGDDVARALDAALELRDRVRDDPELGERLPIRLGVNTGEVVASRDATAGDFLVTGDPVNVAARLQQAAEPWTILVGERAANAAPEGFAFGPVDGIVARGKTLPIATRELLGHLPAGEAEHTPFVGRATDLAELDLIAGRAFAERRPYLVSIIAAPGVGKSRLLEEFLARLRAADPTVAVAVAQCLPYGQRLTYWPLRALLLELLELPADTPPEEIRGAVQRWLAEAGDERPERTADLLAATVGAVEAEQVDRTALFAAWRSTIELAAARRPLLLLVEDLHWSSDSLLDLVEFILQPRGDVPLLMIALARPELLDRRPTWGGGRRNVVSIALEPLGDGEVAELVANLLDGPAPDIVRSVVEHADGNPFYAGEIVRSVIEQVPDLRDTAAVDACLAALPDTVQATVLARLDVLPPEARRQLQLGSVFGRVFPGAGIVALDPGMAGSSAAASDELLERDLIRPAGREAYAFRHILIREVAYGTMTRAERISLHEGAGAWLEATAGGDAEGLAELIAYHYREAISLARLIGQPVGDASRRRAVVWLSRAAGAAASGAATLEAARHLRAAIELADPDEQPELYMRLGQTQLGGDEGLGAFARAYELGREQGRSADFLLRALALRLTAMTRWFASVARQPSLEAFERLVGEARELMEQATDERARAMFFISQAFVPFWLANLGRHPDRAVLAEAERAARRGLEIAERLDDAQLMSAALDGLGGVMSSEGDHQGALATARRRMSIENRLGLQERLDAHNVVAWQSSLVGRLDEAIAAAERGLADVQPGQAPYFALAVASWRPYAMALRGRWDEVPAATERCRQLWAEGGRGTSGYALSGFIAGLDVARARRDESAIERWSAVIEEIVGQFEEHHPTRRLLAFVGPDVEALATDVAAHAGLYGERLHHVERAFAACADRDQRIAPEAVDEVAALALERGTRPLLGQALRVRGLQRGAEADLRDALALFEEIGARPYVARAQIELGQLAGEPTLLAQGLVDLEELGDVDQLARVHQRLS